MTPRRSELFVGVLIALGGFASGAQAQEAAAAPKRSFAFITGVSNTDNIGRTPDNEVSETILTAGILVDVEHQTSRLESSLNGRVEYFEYMDDTYDGEIVGRLDGRARVALMPGRIFWNFDDSFGQEQVDRFEPATPANRENINYFSTGPDFDFHFGQSWFTEIGARYVLVDYELSDLDAQRGIATAGFGRELSDQSRVSLNAGIERIEFDDDTVLDYDRRTAYLRYEVSGSRTDFKIDAGGSEVDDGETTSGGLFRVEITRRMSSTAELKLSGGQQITDSADSFRDRPLRASDFEPTSPATQSTGPFERRNLDLSFSMERNRTGIELGLRYDDDDYLRETGLDVVRKEIGLAVKRQLTPTFSGRVFGSFDSNDYDEADIDYDDMRYGLGVEWRATRHIGLDLSVEHVERDSDTVADYDEDRITLNLAWHAL
jgi:putative beta-barrel porin BBP2